MKILKNISFYRIVVIVFSLGVALPSMATYFQTVESLAKQSKVMLMLNLVLQLCIMKVRVIDEI